MPLTVHCDGCGELMQVEDQFCSGCGKRARPASRSAAEQTLPSSAPVSKGDVSPQLPAAPARMGAIAPQAKRSGAVFWLVAGLGLLLAIVGVLRTSHGTDDKVANPDSAAAANEAAPPPVNQTGPPAPAPPPEKPPTEAELKAALKQVREKWIEDTQKDLWREGLEMTFQDRGTTLYVRYLLAGDAFKFQFQEQFVDVNAETLRQLGFTRIELTNDDEAWYWNLKSK